MRTRDRLLVLRAQLRLLLIVLIDIGILCIIDAFVMDRGLDWHGWVVGVVALILSLATWIVWGTRHGGWPVACATTWVAHVVAAGGLFMWSSFGVASLPGGLIYGSIWAAALLLPVLLISTLVRDPGD